MPESASSRAGARHNLKQGKSMKLMMVLGLGLVISLSAVSANSSRKVETLSQDQMEQEMNKRLDLVNEITARRYQNRNIQVYR